MPPKIWGTLQKKVACLPIYPGMVIIRINQYLQVDGCNICGAGVGMAHTHMLHLVPKMPHRPSSHPALSGSQSLSIVIIVLIP